MSGFRVARIIGIPIYIHFTWFIIFGVLAWSLSEGYFPSRYPDLPPSSYWAKGLVASVLLFASVLFHELGHSVVAKRNGIGIVSITLFIFGGLARLKQDPGSAWVEFKVAIGGPAASFLLAAAFYGASRTGIGGPGAMAVSTYLALVNMMLGAFNLIPAFPLDGGRVLRSIVWIFMGRVRATRVASTMGNLFAYFLILIGVYGLLLGTGLGGLWSILIGWFLKDASTSAYRQVRLNEVLTGVHVRDMMVADCITIPGHISIEDAVREYFLRYGYGGFPVEDRGHVRGLLSLSDVRKVSREDRTRTSVQAVMSPVDNRSTVGANEDIVHALGRMADSGLGRLVVVDESENCVGFITHNGILRQLQLREQFNG